MTASPTARHRLAAIAVLIATLTGVGGAALGGPVSGALLYVGLAGVAWYRPVVIPVQVLAGQFIAARLLLRPDGPAPALILPIVAGVIATAELLAAVARLDTPVNRDPRGELRGAAVSAAIAAAVFGAVALVDGLPGPTGLPAIGLASIACTLLAVLLAKRPARH